MLDTEKFFWVSSLASLVNIPNMHCSVAYHMAIIFYVQWFVVVWNSWTQVVDMADSFWWNCSRNENNVCGNWVKNTCLHHISRIEQFVGSSADDSLSQWCLNNWLIDWFNGICDTLTAGGVHKVAASCLHEFRIFVMFSHDSRWPWFYCSASVLHSVCCYKVITELETWRTTPHDSLRIISLTLSSVMVAG